MFHTPVHKLCTVIAAVAAEGFPQHSTAKDFEYVDHGSIVTLTPRTSAARSWCGEHMPETCARFGYAYAIETRHFGDTLDGIESAGLSI